MHFDRFVRATCSAYSVGLTCAIMNFGQGLFACEGRPVSKSFYVGVQVSMAIAKEDKMPVPKQVQKRYKQDFNRYLKQIQKTKKIQKERKAA